MTGRIAIAITALIIFIIMFLVWLRLLNESLLYLAFIPFVITFTQLLVSPFLAVIGVYKYLSPMLLVNMPGSTKYELHNGTPYDYLLNAKRLRRVGVKRAILIDYITGLRNLINEIENRRLPASLIIEGSSYFFNDRTASSMGFRMEKASVNHILNAAFNYFDLFWMYSLANKRLSFPNIFKMKTIKTTGGELTKNKEFLEKLLSRLERDEQTSASVSTAS